MSRRRAEDLSTLAFYNSAAGVESHVSDNTPEVYQRLAEESLPNVGHVQKWFPQGQSTTKRCVVPAILWYEDETSKNTRKRGSHRHDTTRCSSTPAASPSEALGSQHLDVEQHGGGYVEREAKPPSNIEEDSGGCHEEEPQSGPSSLSTTAATDAFDKGHRGSVQFADDATSSSSDSYYEDTPRGFDAGGTPRRANIEVRLSSDDERRQPDYQTSSPPGGGSKYVCCDKHLTSSKESQSISCGPVDELGTLTNYAEVLPASRKVPKRDRVDDIVGPKSDPYRLVASYDSPADIRRSTNEDSRRVLFVDPSTGEASNGDNLHRRSRQYNAGTPFTDSERKRSTSAGLLNIEGQVCRCHDGTERGVAQQRIESDEAYALGGELVSVQRHPRYIKDCLLYTSDAADE